MMPSDETASHEPGDPRRDHDARHGGPPDQAASREFAGYEDNFGLEPRPRGRRRDPLIGTDLGGFRIIRLLGEGGMGRVYEAEQESPRRTVAVKVIRRGITSEKTMRRFEREAEFLGKLQHPCIAQMYIVGSYSSDEGDVPFFVMEYIPNAKSISTFAADNKLGLDDRLRLFISVCEAVAHGHERGIVHRDLKPGNILIDADGMPKVIDFGVARSTDSDFSLTSMKTDTGQLVGTVQYMSPEQFGDSPEGIDGRADVYSLGVVLHELASGVLPYEVRKKKMHEAARIICEDIPPSLRSRDKAIPRDVSLIVERCLEKNRRMRYQGAAALAADLRQYLAGERLALSWKDRLRPIARVAKPRWLLLLTVLAGTVILATGTAMTVAARQSPPAQAMATGSAAITMPPELPDGVQDSLREAGDSLRSTTGKLAAAMTQGRQQVDSRARELQKDRCNWLVNNALPQFTVLADQCSRQLGQALFDVSKAYPAAPERELATRHAKWRDEFEARRTAALADLEAVQQSCTAMISAAESDPAGDSLAKAEQSIKDRMQEWHAESIVTLEDLVRGASQDLMAFAKDLHRRYSR